MKDRIHLSEVRLDNFRSFGPNCRIPLRAGPSVLVVAGPNGLGKTTLIEGIEWALTGRIRRFNQDESEVDRALTRRGATPGSHTVTLTFSEGKPITRGPQCTPSLSDVLDVLRNPAWPHEIETLVPYLGLTHVLSQSSTLRLTSRDPEKRWSDLSELTGAERIERMIKQLGQSTKTRLTIGANKEAKAREEFEAKRDRLAALLNQVRQNDALLSAGSAYSADQVLDEAKTLVRRLASASGIEAASHDDAALTLEALAAALKKSRSNMAERRAALARAEQQVAPWTAGLAELARLDGAVAGVMALHRAAVARADAELRLVQWERRRSFLAQQPTADAAVKAAADRHEQLTRVMKDAREAQQALEDLNTRLAEADEAVRIEEGVLASWRALAEEERAVRIALRGVADEAEARARAEDTLRAAEEHHRALEQAHDGATLSLAEAEAARVAAAESVADKAAHLSALIKNLHEHDTECPLCLAIHKVDSKDRSLYDRAHEALKREDPGLTATTARAAEAGARVKACLDAIAAHAPLRQAAADALQPYLDRQSAANTRADTLRHRPEIGGRPLDGLAEWLDGRVAAAGTEVARLREVRRALDPDETLTDRRQRAAQTVMSAAEALAAAEKEHADAKVRLDQIVTSARHAVPGSLEVDSVAVNAAVAEARAALAKAEVDADAAKRAVDAPVRTAPEGTPLVQWTKANLDALEQERAGVAGQQDACLRIWTDAGLPGEPAAGALVEALARTVAAEDVVGAVDERCQTLKAGYERWLADRRRHELQRQIDELVTAEKAVDAESCLALLETRIAKAEQAEKQWSRARRISVRIADIIDTKQAEYIATIVDPLRYRADRFDQVWSSFPDLRPDMAHVRRRKGAKGEFAITIDDNDANLYFSEGQAGVKALSFLLAASTAHPWSRWRALLLDDPLQYNDLVHKAAFLDMLRPLVRAESYQVVLSTHDLEEARFIERKCRNAGIAFNLCRLHALGKDGVSYSIDEE
ncbi:AAA family ATPase [Azospirillum tabaci]|uniref:AAA family ATPase n=1 Tax=Azospirillum tabaci TaxID=2752310 RepID=UPI001660A3AE|nr:AAA family ATPase [Azospirillum tabaci]